MLATILAFVIAVVTGLASGPSHAPGLADPSLPTQAVAEQHSKALEALAKSGRPTELPARPENAGSDQPAGDVADTPDDGETAGAPEDVPADGGQANKPETPPVDTSNAPEEIDLSNVPANENASVPDSVGADEHADLPDQAGGNPGDNGGGNAVSSCAKGVGNAAADCNG
jgi:hypothetical protein